MTADMSVPQVRSLKHSEMRGQLTIVTAVASRTAQGPCKWSKLSCYLDEHAQPEHPVVGAMLLNGM